VVPRTVSWPSDSAPGDFVSIYDWDILTLDRSSSAVVVEPLVLCAGVLPCTLRLQGGGSLRRERNGSLICTLSAGCTGMSLRFVRLECSDPNPAVFAPLVVEGITLQIHGSSLVGCASASDGGAIEARNGALVLVSETEFRGTHSDGSGGAIHSAQSTVWLVDSEFVNCSAAKGGGALDAAGGTVNISRVRFTRPTALSDGGAIRAYGAANLSIESSIFRAGHSNQRGGAVAFLGEILLVNHSQFISCSSKQGGGAIWSSCLNYYPVMQCGIMDIFQSHFEACSTEGAGGCIKVSSVAVKVQRSQFFSCSSGLEGGGALALMDSAATSLFLCTLWNNWATGKGGALLVLGGVLAVDECEFSCCHAGDSGGAIAASGSIKIAVDRSNFSSNNANGLGGGAFYMDESPTQLTKVRCIENFASAGGGGALLWSGRVAPIYLEEMVVSNTVDNQRHEASLEGMKKMCVTGNSAMYGPCVASTYQWLNVSQIPGAQSPAYAGIAFAVLITKCDAYNQTIISDSISLVQARAGGQRYAAYRPNTGMTISGTGFVGTMLQGSATLYLEIIPSFSNVNSELKQADIEGQPLVFIEGIDRQTSFTMRSADLPVFFMTGSGVCPVGHVLSLSREAGTTGNITLGSCLRCPNGKYSVDPLSGYDPKREPSCWNCPIRAQCIEGSLDAFPTGQWIISNGMYKLVGCPPGSKLVNYLSGAFIHDIQVCQPCTKSQYILDSNDPNCACQGCPNGAVCNGSTVTSLVPDSKWSVDSSRCRIVLVSCPAGYELLSATQECNLCPAASYCVGGSAQSVKCQYGLFSQPGSNSSSSCVAAVMVELSLSIPMPQENFTSVFQARYCQCLAEVSGVPTNRVIIWSISAQRRLVSNASSSTGSRSLIAVFNIVVGDDYAADQLLARLDTARINAQAVAEGLPMVQIQSVRINSPSITTTDRRLSILIVILSVVMGLLLIAGGKFARKMCMTKVADEERKLIMEMGALRQLLHLTKSNGYFLSSERVPFWRHGPVVVVSRSQLEAAARLRMFLEYEVEQLNSLALLVRGDTNDVVLHGGIESLQYQALKSWILEVACFLVRPDGILPEDIDAAEEGSRNRQPDLRQTMRWKFEYFVKYVARATVWSDCEGALFKSLQARVSKYLDAIAEMCTTRFLQLTSEKRGVDLISYYAADSSKPSHSKGWHFLVADSYYPQNSRLVCCTLASTRIKAS
jgi:hypothetical protein